MKKNNLDFEEKIMKEIINISKKGLDTRNKIIQAARKIFYEYGYTHSTIKMIKEEAGVSLSAIPYYFEKKDQMVVEIYNDFLGSIYDFINEKLTEEIDSYLLQFHASKIYYDIIINNPKNYRFYYEVSIAQSNYEFLNPFMKRIYSNYARDFNIPLTDKELSLLRMADSGSRREILINFYNNQINLTLDEFIDYVTSIAGNLLGINKLVAEKYGILSSQYVKTLNYKHFKFLV